MGISDGLVAAYNKQASGASWLDLTGNGHNVPLTNTTWEADGLQANANGEFGLFDNSGNSLIDSEAGTFVIKFKSLSAFDDGIIRALSGVLTGATGDFFLDKSGGNSLLFLIEDDGGDHFITTKSLPNWQTGTQVAVQWNRAANIYDSKKLAINIDGAYVTPLGSKNATAWNSFTVNSNLALLNDYTVQTRHANGIADHVYIFNTVKTEAELAAIFADHSIILNDFFDSTRRRRNKGIGKGH